MTAIFRFRENVAGFGKNSRRERPARGLDRALVGQKLDFAPVLPRFERLTFKRCRKAHAEALIEMQADDA